MRIYVDTNVFGAYPVNSSQEQEAIRLLNQVLSGRYTLVTSFLVEAELASAPLFVQGLFVQLSTLPVTEWLRLDPTTEAFTDAYILTGVVTANHRTDALHVALATIAKYDVLTSWNARDFTTRQRRTMG